MAIDIHTSRTPSWECDGDDTGASMMKPRRTRAWFISVIALGRSRLASRDACADDAINFISWLAPRQSGNPHLYRSVTMQKISGLHGIEDYCTEHRTSYVRHIIGQVALLMNNSPPAEVNLVQ
ncbi:hypothetical protein [Klebsiella pneumoniae]|uniref:hypothetical protein n=1 Tax=Klebsiella pneumoniae TaxID=573 RepID=UPI001D17DDF4|nr:hypothetical protein [Klebsiella pneumoniae]